MDFVTVSQIRSDMAMMTLGAAPARAPAAMRTIKFGTRKVVVPGGGMVDVEEVTTKGNIGSRRRFLASEQSLRKESLEVEKKPALLAKVESLKLLTKAEKAGLLSLAESLGLTLTTIEELGLLSKAEELGVLSAAEDRTLPGKLILPAFALLAAAPALVYVVPDTDFTVTAAQYVGATLLIAAGSALFGASNLIGTLQKK